MKRWLGAALGLAVGMVASVTLAGQAWAKTFEIRPGPDAEARLQEAFTEARQGDAIVIRQGRYELNAGLRLTADRVVVRGDGPDRTVLSFRGQGRPGAAVTVVSDIVTLRDFAIEDAKGDGVRAQGADGLEVANFAVTWSAPPAAEADAFAISEASQLSMTRLTARGAPGAGLRLTQVRTGIVQDSQFLANGVGVAVHNSISVDVLANRIEGNAIGAMLRDRPGALAGPGRDVRLFRNRIESNNAARPAVMDQTEAGVWPSTGVGVAVLATGNAFVRENVIAEHATVGLLIMAEPVISRDATFNALPRDVAVIANSFGRSGFAPAGGDAVFDGADIIWDGAEIYVAGGQVKSEPVRLSIVGNVGLRGDVRFSNLNLATAGADGADAAPEDRMPDPVNLPEPRPVEIRR